MDIDEEDETRRLLIGIKIRRLQGATQQVRDCFIKNDEPIYGDAASTEDIMSAIRLYIKGESADYIGDAVFQSDGEPVKKLFKLLGINID